jgi:hypothetical protein
MPEEDFLLGCFNKAEGKMADLRIVNLLINSLGNRNYLFWYV